jgi:hypothetical protein
MRDELAWGYDEHTHAIKEFDSSGTRVSSFFRESAAARRDSGNASAGVVIQA